MSEGIPLHSKINRDADGVTTAEHPVWLLLQFFSLLRCCSGYKMCSVLSWAVSRSHLQVIREEASGQRHKDRQTLVCWMEDCLIRFNFAAVASATS